MKKERMEKENVRKKIKGWRKKKRTRCERLG